MFKRFICLTSFVVMLALAGNVSADLVAHWMLEEGSGTTTVAAVGSPEADGTLMGATWITSGLAPIYGTGAAAFFTSANSDRIETNYPGVVGQAARSVTAWIRAEPTQNNNAVMVGWGANSAAERYSFRLNGSASNGPLWALRLEIQGSRSVTTTPLNDGQWHHVVVTNGDGATIDDISFYLDGQVEEVTGTAGGGLINTASTSVVLGNSGHSIAGYGFDGAIDDVRIYDHVLSLQEVQRLASRPRAYGPEPADGAIHEDTWVNLSWSPGSYAVSHDVYLGDNFDDVNNGAPDVFRGNQDSTLYIAGFFGFAYPEGLVPGTTYYWRIDEVNDADPNSPWKGGVWSFSIPPKTAYNPSPPDAAEFVDPNAELSWTPGFGAKLHTLYLSNSLDNINNDIGGVPCGAATYKPGPLELEKVYYWRIDEFDAMATHKGDIWSFTTPGAPGNPQPANGAADVQINSTLNWTPATTAASHDLYLGTDKDAVKNATTASPEYKGNKALGSESYDPGKLSWYSSYYWRVDAVYDSVPVKGLVWSFTTADFILVDDFESYNDIDPPDPESNRIFEGWIDGYGTADNGALVGNELPPYADQVIVQDGIQSMPYYYDNNLKTSEATLTLVSARDWTQEGVTKLSLWYRGASANAAERMYVALNGTAVVYNSDPAATQTTQWTEWVIDLTEFTGVNLANVNTITIGFGTKGSPAAGGSGQMYIDSIRLYR